MEVKLISYSQPVNSDGDKNPLSIAELAASVCYDSEPTDTYRIVWTKDDSRTNRKDEIGSYWKTKR